MIGQVIWAKNVNRKAIKQKSPPKSSKNEMFIFGLCSTSDDQSSNRAKNINQNTKNNQKGPLNHQKIKFLFLYYFQLLMIGRAIWAKNVNQNAKKWKRPPKSSKNKMFIFGLCSTLDDWRGWSMDSNPVCHPSPAKKMKCSFLDYIQLLVIGRVIWAKNVDQNIKKQKGSAKSLKNKMFIFWLCSTSDDQSSNPSKKHQPKHQKNPKMPPKSSKIKCLFLDYIQLLMIGRVIWAKNIELKHKKMKKAPWSHRKVKCSLFGLHSTSDDWPGWSMDLNPICHPSPAKKMKCSFLDHVQLLMICQAGRWTWTPSATHLQPKKWNAHFWIMFNFWWSDERSEKKTLTKMQKTPKRPPKSSKNKMFIFGLMLNFWWSAERSNEKMSTKMQKNEKGSLSHRKIKCSLLDYIQLLMIGWSDLSKKIDNWNVKKQKRPPKSSKNKMFIFGLCSTSDDRAERSKQKTWTKM